MDWQNHGVKIVPAGDLDPNTPQTPGMTRAAAITHARTGASKLWAGRSWFNPTQEPAPITTVNSKPFFTSSAAGPECDGATAWSSVVKPGRAISSMFRLTC